MLFTEDQPIIQKLRDEAQKIVRQNFKENHPCPRCGSKRDKIERGVCTGKIEGKLCLLGREA